MDEDDNVSHKSLEEPLVDSDVPVSSPEPEGWNVTVSDAEAWLEEEREAEEFLDGLEREGDHAGGDEVIHPVPLGAEGGGH